MIRSDQLGKKGEARFEEICAEAGITCNRSADDTAGWDFLLNFPAPDDAAVSLDSRLPGVTCYVQVKTVFAPAHAAKLSLNMAERLAKYPNPSFICLFVVDKALHFINAYLIHMEGDRLAAVLHRLRQAEKDKQHTRLNKLSITILPLEHESFALKGPDLALRIQTLVGPDVDAYIASKHAQRETLGYEKSPYEMSFQFETNDLDVIFATFAGRNTEVPVQINEMFESRFRIRLPFGAPGPAKITIQPNSVEDCRIRYIEKPRCVPIIFEGKVTRVRLNGITRLYITFQAFTCIIEQGPHGTKMQFDEHSLDAPVAIDEYIGVMKLFSGLTTEIGTLEFEFGEGYRTIRINSSDLQVDGITIHSSRYSSAHIELWQALKSIAEFAGAGPNIKFGVLQVAKVQRRIKVLHDLLTNPNCQIELIKEEGHPELILTTGDNILPLSFRIGDVLVASYCSLNIQVDKTGDVPIPIFSKLQLQAIRFLPTTEEHQRNFILDARSAENINTVLCIPGALVFDFTPTTALIELPQ